MPSPNTEYDLIAPSGRIRRFRRKRLVDHLALAVAVVVSRALWAVLLWPAVEWFTR